MIFKNEGEPNIKKITTAIPEERSEHSWIPNISDQEWGSIRNIVAERVRAWPYDDFPEILAPLKMLGLPSRTLNPYERKKIVSGFFSHLRGISDDDMQLIFKDLYRIILHDRTIVDEADSKTKERLLRAEEVVRSAIHQRSIDPNIYAWMKVINPRRWVRPEPEQLLSMGMIPRPSQDSSIPLHAHIASMAALRVIDDLYDPEFKSEDWHAVKGAIQDFVHKIIGDGAEKYINVIRLARLLFHLRILTAKKVYVDDTGLHIVDQEYSSPSTAASVESKPLPLKKHI